MKALPAGGQQLKGYVSAASEDTAPLIKQVQADTAENHLFDHRTQEAAMKQAALASCVLARGRAEKVGAFAAKLRQDACLQAW